MFSVYCVFIYHTISDHLKAISQVSVNAVFHVTLKLHSLIFNNQHRINYRLQDPCCPGLTLIFIHLNSLIAQGMEEKEVILNYIMDSQLQTRCSVRVPKSSFKGTHQKGLATVLFLELSPVQIDLYKEQNAKDKKQSPGQTYVPNKR